MPVLYDLNVRTDATTDDILRYVRCGYTRLAINNILDLCEVNDNSKLSKNEKMGIRTKMESALQPVKSDMLVNEFVLNCAEKTGSTLKLFSRITIVANNVEVLKTFMYDYKMQLKAYDIVAICPKSEEVLALALTAPSAKDKLSSTIEMVTFDHNEAAPALKRKQALSCRDWKVAVEINLSAAITGAHGRCAIAKFVSDAVINRLPPIFTITSGAQSPWLVRNLIGLSCIVTAIGMPEKIVREFNANAENVLKRGLSRKYTVQGTAAIIQISKIPGVVGIEVLPPMQQTESDDATLRSPDSKKIKVEEK